MNNQKRIFFVTEKQIQQNTILLSGQDFIHLSKVLRIKRGDKIICKSFSGFIYHCQIDILNSQSVICQILTAEKIIEKKKKRKVKIFLCIPRLEVLSSIVAKITELDVDELQLVFSERSYFKKNKKINIERFKKISSESLKQCGRDIPLLIAEPIHLSVLSQEDLGSEASNLLLWECEEKNEMSSVKLKKRVNLFIGSEGGISYQEKDFLTEKLNFKSVGLSKNILRVETAVLFSLAKVLLI